MSAGQERAARDIVDDLARAFDERSLDPRAVQLDAFHKVDRAWYARSAAALEGLGFKLLRDLDASALLSPATPPTPLRCMLGGDGAVGAALYHSIPKSPGFVLKLLLRVLGQWREARVVELMSFVGDEVIDTLNVGSHYFFSAPPWLRRTTLEPDAPVPELLARHLRAVEEAEARTGQARLRAADFDAFWRAREDSRVRQNQWRREIGGCLPEELDRMLAPHGAGGAALRPFLEAELERRGLRAR